MTQMASNFNCLEVPGRRSAPDSGYLVDSAPLDATQGPAAVFGQLSGYLYRCHFVFGGQTRSRQINLLDKVSKYFGITVNGKLTLPANPEPITDKIWTALSIISGLGYTLVNRYFTRVVVGEGGLGCHVSSVLISC